MKGPDSGVRSPGVRRQARGEPGSRRRRPFDLTRLGGALSGLVVGGSLLGLLLFLTVGSIPVLRKEGWSFFTVNLWAYRKALFGAAAMIYGSVVVSLIALVLAGIVGVGAAIFISEFCRPRWRPPLKLLVELLAGIPSVVYGLLGVLFLREWMAGVFDSFGLFAPSGDTLLTAGLLLSLMILPTVATLCDDALQSVPARFRDAARGLGLTRSETIVTAVLPHAIPGIVGALLLALGRAVGETIAVFLVVGRADNRLPQPFFSLQPWIDAGQTITSKLGGAETNIAVGDPLHTSAMLGLALSLFVSVLAMTFAADVLRARLRR